MARMRKFGESKTTRIMMATVPHVTSGLGLRKFQVDGFLLTRVYVRYEYRSPWPRSLRRGSMAARFLGMRVRISPQDITDCLL